MTLLTLLQYAKVQLRQLWIHFFAMCIFTWLDVDFPWIAVISTMSKSWLYHCCSQFPNLCSISLDILGTYYNYILSNHMHRWRQTSNTPHTIDKQLCYIIRSVVGPTGTEPHNPSWMGWSRAERAGELHENSELTHQYSHVLIFRMVWAYRIHHSAKASQITVIQSHDSIRWYANLPSFQSIDYCIHQCQQSHNSVSIFVQVHMHIIRRDTYFCILCFDYTTSAKCKWNASHEAVTVSWLTVSEME